MKKLLVCIAGALTLISCQKDNNKTIENTTSEINNSAVKKTACYLDVTQSKDNPAIRDSMSLTVNFDGTKVTGSYNWIPIEKDKKTGTYEGIVKDSIVNAVYTYSAEGQNLKEELIFKLENNQVMIKSGELEERDGIWKLKDADKAKYNITLSKISCK